MLYKSLAGSVKVDAEGVGSAVFATLNVVDKDHDITMPGAFGSQVAKLSPAHDWSAPGMGLAKIRESGNQAIADFQFNLGMASGKEWAESLKFNQEHSIPQEWSYGYDIEDAAEEVNDGERVQVLKKLKVYEVSPVMVGAGLDTRTLSMKSRKLEDHFADVVAQNRDFSERLADLKEKREKDGRSLSRANCERLKTVVEELGKIIKAADGLIVEPTDEAAMLAVLQFELESGHNARQREALCR